MSSTVDNQDLGTISYPPIPHSGDDDLKAGVSLKDVKDFFKDLVSGKLNQIEQFPKIVEICHDVAGEVKTIVKSFDGTLKTLHTSLFALTFNVAQKAHAKWGISIHDKKNLPLLAVIVSKVIHIISGIALGEEERKMVLGALEGIPKIDAGDLAPESLNSEAPVVEKASAPKKSAVKKLVGLFRSKSKSKKGGEEKGDDDAKNSNGNDDKKSISEEKTPRASEEKQ